MSQSAPVRWNTRPKRVPPRYRNFTDAKSGIELTECTICGSVFGGGGNHGQGCDQRYIGILQGTIIELLGEGK